MDEFKTKLAEYGLFPESIIISDKIQRFDVDGDKKVGWYYFNSVGNDSYGAFGNWKEGLSETYTSFQPNKSKEEIDRINAEFKRIKDEATALRKQEQAQVAIKALELWNTLSSGNHPYLEKKQINSHGSKVYKESLVIPVIKNGKIVSLQFIDLSGKRFLSGGETSGGAYVIKGTKDNIVICEGFSTGASIFEATGFQVFISFYADNLIKVAKRVRELYPDNKIIIACDNDKYKDFNTGVDRGTKASKEIKAVLAVPNFKNEETKPTDFNDLHILEGLEAVKNQIIPPKSKIQKDIEDWLKASPGEFTVRDLDYDLTFTTAEQRKERLEILEKLVFDNKLERTGTRRGMYRPYQMDLTPMTIGKIDFKYMDFWLPFRLHDYVGIMPGNIIIVAGAPNAGKTALLMNLIKNNRDSFKNIDYFNSEAGEEELNLRLSKFDGVPSSAWDNLHAWERSENFADVIRPGKGNLNVIDFLECHDEFFKIGQYIKDIHAKLDGAIAVIAIQKNAGQDNGLGGFRSMEKARLAIAMDNGKMKVTKAKNFKTTVNPNGFIADYKLANGCRFVPIERNGEVWYKQDFSKGA